MKLTIHKLGLEQWADLSEKAHQACFNEKRPVNMDRIDFALVCVDDDQKLMVGYTTMREIDSETIYWQHGGSFPEFRGTATAALGYSMFIQWCRERYKRIVTLIENNNRPMLKLAFHNGFTIVGVRNFKGKVLLEHGIEFEA